MLDAVALVKASVARATVPAVLAAASKTCRGRGGELSVPLGVWLVVLLGVRDGRVAITGKALTQGVIGTAPFYHLVLPCAGEHGPPVG